jgi:hypothetical protein
MKIKEMHFIRNTSKPGRIIIQLLNQLRHNNSLQMFKNCKPKKAAPEPPPISTYPPQSQPVF